MGSNAIAALRFKKTILLELCDYSVKVAHHYMQPFRNDVFRSPRVKRPENRKRRKGDKGKGAKR
jgi:hypothetical protein